MSNRTSSSYLSTEALRTFVMVTEHSSFTLAAQQLARSQPAVTLQIQKLEERLQESLFQRNNGPLKLTQAGEILLGFARRILSLHDELNSAFDDKSLSGKLRFGIPSEFATTILPAVISAFASDHPNVMLDVTCDLSKHLMEAVNRHHYDLILALHDDIHQEGLIKQERLVWVGKRNGPAYQHSAVPLIAAPEGCIYRQRGTLALQQSHKEWRIVYTIPDLSGIQAAIEAGLGVTVLAENTVPANLQILDTEQYDLPELGQIGISLISKNRNQVVQKLIQYIENNV